MNTETVCAAYQDWNGFLIFMLCIVALFLGMAILGLIFNRIDRVQDEAAEKYAKKVKDELRK